MQDIQSDLPVTIIHTDQECDECGKTGSSVKWDIPIVELSGVHCLDCLPGKISQVHQAFPEIARAQRQDAR